MRDLINLVESAQRTVTLWHGGRDLEYSYREFRSHKNGAWEHGPGLYLTTHRETAAKYAKGGGSLYKVTVALGTPISDVRATEDEAKDFVKRFIIGSKRSDILNDIERGFARHKDGTIPIEMLMNLGINYNAIRHSNTGALREYFVSKGVDYALVKNYGGRPETVVVVMNPDTIQSVTPIKAKDVSDDDNILPVDQ